jgi:hypothetical protein
MSGRIIATQGIPLTLRFSKGERNPLFNGLLGPRFLHLVERTRVRALRGPSGGTGYHEYVKGLGGIEFPSSEAFAIVGGAGRMFSTRISPVVG